MAILEVKDLCFSYGRHEVIDRLSFQMNEGEFVCILGKNGCGKTTLLQAILGLLRPKSGTVLLYGEDIRKLSERELAKKVAYIPQSHVPPFPFTVLDVVLMGRTPYMNRTYHSTPEDVDIAREALDTMGISSYADRIYTQLSGGERQMVIIARAIAQQSDILIMDEPTASLDFSNQYLVLSQMLRLSKNKKSILMVTHNPDHATYCANHVVAMQDGHTVADGTVSEVITEPILNSIYGMDICVRNVVARQGRTSTVCIPIPRDTSEFTEKFSSQSF